MNTNFSDFIKNVNPNQIGKWEKFSKNLVVYNGKEWKIEKFNIFQLIARNWFGFYKNTHSSTIKNGLMSEYKNLSNTDNIKTLIIKIKQASQNVLQDMNSTVSVVRAPTPPTESYLQVQVLNQNYEPQGYERCGFHAFKNALVGLQVAVENANPKLFDDKAVFQDFYRFVVQFKPEYEEGEGDASIAVLSEALENLRDKSEVDIPSALHDFQRIYKAHPNSISMMNLENGNMIFDQGNFMKNS